MRKNCIRLSLVAASAFAIFGQASAGTINFWFNRSTDLAATQLSNYSVAPGVTAFNIYATYSGFSGSATGGAPGSGALSSIGILFGYSTTTKSGTAGTLVAAPSNSSFVGFTPNSIFTSNGTFEVGRANGGGGGPADGVTRPYGLSASYGTFNTTGITGTDNNLTLLVGTIQLNVNAGVTNASMWSFAGTDSFTSSAADVDGNFSYPASPFSATITAVPEPASLIALGLGGAALLRRRRANK